MDSLSSIRVDVSSIGGTQFAGSQSAPPANNPVMNGAAKALGMSSSDLISALQNGQSLSSIASSKGVSQDKLVAAMATSIQQANPGVSADQATKVATAMATRTPPAGGTPPATKGGGHSGGGGPAAASGGASTAATVAALLTPAATNSTSGVPASVKPEDRALYAQILKSVGGNASAALAALASIEAKAASKE
jgi:hypothetical protein